MKRTLIEVLCGLAVIVMMTSFHHRISRLQSGTDDVGRLRSLVEETAASAGSKTEIRSSREQILAEVEARLGALQAQLEMAEEEARNASFLKSEIDATRQEASLLRAELLRDVQQTKQLVGAYQDEMRAQSSRALSTIESTQRRVDAIAYTVRPDPERLNSDLLAPTVQLNGDDTVGSGTLIRSSRNVATGEVENYVVTSYHVVRNILADTPSAKTDGIEVTIYQGAPGEKTRVRGRMVNHDVEIDAALLRLDTEQIFERVASVMPRSHAHTIEVWEPVYALGCPLGNDPIPTCGELSSKSNVLNGTNYWMINAPTYYGNSGGGVYVADGHYLIGVFSKIYTHGKGNPIVVPHMGLCTPITAIYDWLEREQLAHVVPQIGDESYARPSAAAMPPK